jgi:hypothetical protein
MPPGGAPQGPPLDVKGTIEAIQMAAMTVTTDANVKMMVQPAPTCKIEVKGTAEAGFLAPGMYVSFSADVDKKKGATTEKVSKLTLFMPNPDKKPGVTAPGGGDGGKGGPPVEKLEVAGQITSVKNGSLSLAFPPNEYVKKLSVDLADSAEVTVDIVGMGPAAMMFVQQGSAIEGKGKQVNNNPQMPMGMLTEMKVTLATPLAATQTNTKKGGHTKGPAASKKGHADTAPSQEGIAGPGFGDDKGAKTKKTKKPAHDAI